MASTNWYLIVVFTLQAVPYIVKNRDIHYTQMQEVGVTYLSKIALKIGPKQNQFSRTTAVLESIFICYVSLAP